MKLSEIRQLAESAVLCVTSVGGRDTIAEATLKLCDLVLVLRGGVHAHKLGQVNNKAEKLGITIDE